HIADVIKSPSARPPADLPEIPHGENGGAARSVFEELGEKHGAVGHVHPDAQRVGATNDLEQAALGQLFHQNAVFGKKSGMMDAHAMPEHFLDLLPVRAAEVGSLQHFGNLCFFRLRAKITTE